MPRVTRITLDHKTVVGLPTGTTHRLDIRNRMFEEEGIFIKGKRVGLTKGGFVFICIGGLGVTTTSLTCRRIGWFFGHLWSGNSSDDVLLQFQPVEMSNLVSKRNKKMLFCYDDQARIPKYVINTGLLGVDFYFLWKHCSFRECKHETIKRNSRLVFFVALVYNMTNR